MALCRAVILFVGVLLFNLMALNLWLGTFPPRVSTIMDILSSPFNLAPYHLSQQLKPLALGSMPLS